MKMMSSSRTNALPVVEGYSILERIGSGSYSVVYRAICKTDKETVAIKCVEKNKLHGSAADNIITEIRLLKLLKHDNIVQMKDFCWDNKYIFIILEYCDGGDLSCFIRKKKKLPELVCKRFLQQLAQALKYLRDNNVCHMDLKPQNLLLSTKPRLTLKLGDFGFSQFLSVEEMQKTLRGSPLYMAPEMLLFQDYDAKVDLWSVGVIMYECLFGKAPYSSNNVQELAEKISSQKAIEIPPNPGISSECRDLLTRLLQHDPKQRISFEDFFSHSFLDLEHMPSSESYKKGVQTVCEAVRFDKEKKYVDAFHAYCEALRYFVPLISVETDIRKKTALRSKINEYITRAENLKNFVHSRSENLEANQSFSYITRGADFRELNFLCGDNSQLADMLETGCNAEQHYAEGQYRLALDKFQTTIRFLMVFLAKEPPGRRRDLLYDQVRHWIKEAESAKALLSASDLYDANAVIDKQDVCHLQ